MNRATIQTWLSQVSEALILQEAWLFGSFAQKAAQPNDIDLLVIVETLPDNFDFQTVRDFSKEHFRHQGLPVDLCIFNNELGQQVLAGTEMQRHAQKLSL